MHRQQLILVPMEDNDPCGKESTETLHGLSIQATSKAAESGGRDREFVYWVNEDDLPDDNGDAQSRGAPRQLQRTGCV